MLATLTSTWVLAADAEKKCELGLVDTLPVSMNNLYRVPMIAGSINGKPTTVAVDLGSYNTKITKSVLDAMGITSWNTRDSMGGSGGNFRIMEVRLGELKAGPASGRGVFEVIDTSSASGFNMGADMLLRNDLEISLKENQLKFFRTRNCEKSHLAYWSQDAVVLPFKIHGDDDVRPIFKVKVNGKEMTAVMSTASSTTTLNVNAARKLGLTVGSPQVTEGNQVKGMGKDMLSYWNVKIDALEIGEERISNVTLGMIKEDVGVADVMFGLDFVRAHRIYISMDQRQIYFTYIGGEIFAR
ncbi:MAG: retropepsin-like aspartic protease [Pseudomonadota bacterium]